MHSRAIIIVRRHGKCTWTPPHVWDNL